MIPYGATIIPIIKAKIFSICPLSEINLNADIDQNHEIKVSKENDKTINEYKKSENITRDKTTLVTSSSKTQQHTQKNDDIIAYFNEIAPGWDKNEQSSTESEIPKQDLLHVFEYINDPSSPEFRSAGMRNYLKDTVDRERVRKLEKLKTGSPLTPHHKEGAKLINIIRNCQWVDNNKILGNLIHSMNEECIENEVTEHEIINPKIKIQKKGTIFGDTFRKLSAFSDKRLSNSPFEREDESEIFNATTPLDLYEREGFIDE